VAETIAGTHCTSPRRDGQAECFSPSIHLQAEETSSALRAVSLLVLEVDRL